MKKYEIEARWFNDSKSLLPYATEVLEVEVDTSDLESIEKIASYYAQLSKNIPSCDNWKIHFGQPLCVRGYYKEEKSVFSFVPVELNHDVFTVADLTEKEFWLLTQDNKQLNADNEAILKDLTLDIFYEVYNQHESGSHTSDYTLSVKELEQYRKVATFIGGDFLKVLEKSKLINVCGSS